MPVYLQAFEKTNASPGAAYHEQTKQLTYKSKDIFNSNYYRVFKN